MKLSKRVFSVILSSGLLLCNFSSTANAANFKTSFSTSDKPQVTYNKNAYTQYCISRVKVTCKSDYRSMWSNLDKGDTLGEATIRAYYLEPKSKTDGVYYAIAGCEVQMNPQSLGGNVMGMSQLADFRIKTKNPYTRVCSPTAELRKGDSSASKDSSLSGSFGLGYNTSDKWSPIANFGYTSEKSTSFTNSVSNVELIQNDILGDYCRWNYDYISKDKNKSWNSYRMSSSRVAGQVVYSIGSAVPKYINRWNNIPKELKYEIIFGGGHMSSGKVANRMGASTNRNMSSDTGTITLSY